jgi:alkylation response protein AidB-like acyl-CoA dehydrogenase
MALLLNEEQTMLRDSARSFLTENAPVAQLRRLRDSRDAAGYSAPLWSAFAEQGYTGMLVPEEHGGLGLGMVEAGVLMEQMGRTLCASPFLASAVVAATALRHGGSAAQRQQWLPGLASGESIATLAVDEAGKHRPERIALPAQRQGAGWLLDGRKGFVLDGHVAALFIVAARIAESGDIALFLVRRDAPGVQVARTLMVDAHNAATLVLAQVCVPDAARLGDGSALDAALDAGRAAAAAELLGIADEVFERTLLYLKERKQFGRLIGEFQALQHRAAALYVDIELARAALAKALHSLDSRAPSATRDVSVAKAKCAQAATLAVQEGVQMHGGIGMTDAFDIGLFMKRARVLAELFGDAGYHMDRLAAMRGY